MTDQLISFETAKLAKEKGFGGKELTTDYSYQSDKHILCRIPENNKSVFNGDPMNPGNGYSAPTQSLLQKWLRETYFIHIVIQVFYSTIGKEWTFSVDIFYEGEKVIKLPCEDTYEEALEIGEQEALKLIP